MAGANHLVSALIKLAGPNYSEEDLFNKTELDADHVGLEFFARAGYHLDAYLSFETLILTRIRDQSYAASCAQKGQVISQRGTDTHPSTCWRVNEHVLEMSKHKDEYKQWGKEIRNLNIPNKVTLAAAKEEIRAVMAKAAKEDKSAK